MNAASGAITAAEIEAIRQLLLRVGVGPEQLLSSRTRNPAPTFADYVGRVSQAVPSGTRRVYATYWTRVLDVWGNRRLDEPTALEIQQLAETMRATAVKRKNSRGGRTALVEPSAAS